MTTSMERELEALGRFRMGKIIGSWKITQKLDEGGFGSVYKVENVKNKHLVAALKIELNQSDEANHLKLETELLKEIHNEGFRSHIPTLYRSGKKKTYCYMIITLLGENLKRIKDKHYPDGFPLRTLTRIAIQCLYGIKTIHDRGFVHRDIKPGNFVLGNYAVPAQARVVYLIDFGLARAIGFPPLKDAHGKKIGGWVPRKARAHVDFKGTWRFASPSMHEDKEQGRKDDIWSFLYLLIDLYCGLPWGSGDSRPMVEIKKLCMKDDHLMIKMPEEMKFIPQYLRTLDCYQRPDYYRIFDSLDKVRQRCAVTFEDQYEWELREIAAANRNAMRKMNPPPGYTQAAAFFKYDPLKINGPPTAKEEEDVRLRFKKPPSTTPVEKKEGAIDKDAKSPSNAEQSQKTQNLFVNDGSRILTNTTDRSKTTDTENKSKGGADSNKKTVAQGGTGPIRPKKTDPTDKVVARKKKSRSEDSADFIPSCYMNVDIPKHYLMEGKIDQKDIQEGFARIDWGRMASAEDPKKNMPLKLIDSPPNTECGDHKIVLSAEVVDKPQAPAPDRAPSKVGSISKPSQQDHAASGSGKAPSGSGKAPSGSGKAPTGSGKAPAPVEKKPPSISASLHGHDKGGDGAIPVVFRRVPKEGSKEKVGAAKKAGSKEGYKNKNGSKEGSKEKVAGANKAGGNNDKLSVGRYNKAKPDQQKGASKEGVKKINLSKEGKKKPASMKK